jgi:hypothetical protein
MARAMSTTPMPRPTVVPAIAPADGITVHSVSRARRTRRSPSNLLGSGTARVASVPVISTKPCLLSGESQLNSSDAAWPPAYSASADR